MSLTKKKLDNKKKHLRKKHTRLHKYRVYKKHVNTNKKHHNNGKKLSKKYKYKKIMKGGIATYQSNPTTSISVGGNSNASVLSSYTKSDTPSVPPSVISYIPAPLMNLKWSIESGVTNFFNEIFGIPKQYTSSPTDQPIGDNNVSLEPTPMTSNDLTTIKENIINSFSATKATK